MKMKSTDLDTHHRRIYSRILEMCVPSIVVEKIREKKKGQKTRTGAEPQITK